MTGSGSDFDWPSLMRAGIGDLGLAPEVFWRLSPAELLLLLGPGGSHAMNRSAFDALLAQFPDHDLKDGQETGHEP